MFGGGSRSDYNSPTNSEEISHTLKGGPAFVLYLSVSIIKLDRDSEMYSIILQASIFGPFLILLFNFKIHKTLLL